MLTEHTLMRTTPEQQGIASSAVLQLIEALESQMHELHSFMLLRHGIVVAEGWWSPHQPQHPHMLFSLSKSFTSTTVGLAITEGYFSIDDLVLPFFPDETPAEVSDFLASMSVRHLLTMTSGHVEDTWWHLVNHRDGNWAKGFLSVPLRYAPGTRFVYNTGATYMLSAIVQKTTGMKLVDYLQPRLFEPLGIENATWDESPQGINHGGIGLSIRTEDIARFGQLYLQKGMWQGKQLLPEAWVIDATSLQVDNGNYDLSDWTQGYGYQFWRCRHGAYRGDGAFGQYCVVMPEQDAVLAITSGVAAEDMQQPLDLLWEILLPAFNSTPLADDPTAQQRLTEKLAYLAHQPLSGQSTSPIASEVSGRTYVVDANPLNIETLTLNFNESGCAAHFKTAAGDEIISCGYGVWQQGQSALFVNQWLSGTTPLVASGAWTSDDSFTMLVRLYQTPFVHTLVFHFVGDELLIDARVNVSLESTNALLTAHAYAGTVRTI